MKARGLYDPAFEHDACGVGFIVRIDGEKTHDIIEKGVEILCNLEHRGAVGGDQKTGDGAGMLFQIPHKFLRPKKAITKIDAKLFKLMTKYQERTSNHARDAAMLVFKRDSK